MMVIKWQITNRYVKLDLEFGYKDLFLWSILLKGALFASSIFEYSGLPLN